MAEFAASIIGLIQTADIVCRRIYRYIKHVKEAESEVLALCSQTSTLFGTLQSLRLTLDEFDLANDARVVQGRHITACESTLRKLREKLADFDLPQHKSLAFVKSKWKWPFSRSDTLALRDDVAARTHELSLAVSIDNFSTLLRLYDNVKALAVHLHQIDDMVEAQNRIAVTKEKKRVLVTLSPLDPSRQQRTNIRLHHPGTGLWFIDGPFQHWLSTENAKLWVHGIPGAGKTVLASLAIATALRASSVRHAVAYFYCTYNDTRTQDPLHILRALIKQIARQDESAFDLTEQFVDNHLVEETPPALDCSIEDLITLFRHLAECFNEISVLVDGIDECGENTSTVAYYLTLLGSQVHNLRITFFSRELVEMRERVGSFEWLSIAAHSSDLNLYVAAEIEKRTTDGGAKQLRLKDPALKGLIVDTLITKAAGMFRWVAVQLDWLCDQPTDHAIREALETLPPDLFSSYARLLKQKRSPRAQEIVCRALKWIVWEDAIFDNPQGVCEAVAIDDDATIFSESMVPSETALLRYCGSMIRKNAEGMLEAAHFTVKEFLLALDGSEDPELTPYRLNKQRDTLYFARVAVKYLGFPHFAHKCTSLEDVKARLSQHAFRYPVLQNWDRWIGRNEGDARVMQALKDLFDPEQESIFRAWVGETSLAGLEGAHTSLSSELCQHILLRAGLVSQLHYACAFRLPILTKWLLSKGINANLASFWGSPLHWALLGVTAPLNIMQDMKDYRDVSTNINCCSVAVLSALLEAGADTNCKWTATDELAYSMSFLAATTVAAHDAKAFCTMIKGGMRIEQDATALLLSRVSGPAAEEILSCITTDSLGKGAESFILDLKSHLLRQAAEVDKQQDELIELAVTDEQRTRLFVQAVKDDYQSVIALLLDQDESLVEARDSHKVSALHMAIGCGHLATTKLLLARGAKPNARSGRADQVPLLQAVRAADTSFATLLLETGADPLLCDDVGNTIWHYALLGSSPEMLSVVSEISSEVFALIDVSNMVGYSPLMLACRNHMPHKVRELLSLGATPFCSDNHGTTLLHTACRAGDVAFVKYLLTCGHDPHTVDSRGRNAFAYAISKWRSQPGSVLNTDVADLLYKFDPTLAAVLYHGQDPELSRLIYECAVSCGCLDGDIPFEDSFYPLISLIQSSTFPLLRDTCFTSLLRMYANEGRSTYERGICGIQFLEFLCQSGSQSLDDVITEKALEKLFIELALRENARPPTECLEEVLEALITYLPEKVLRQFRNVPQGWNITCSALKADLPSWTITRAVFNRFIDADSRTGVENWTALECASSIGLDSSLFDQLIQASTHLDAQKLHFAAGQGSPEQLRSLIAAGLTVDKLDHNKATPILYACRNGNSENAKILLEAGADETHLDQFGVDCMLEALQCDSVDCVKLFLSTWKQQEQIFTATVRHPCISEISWLDAHHVAARKGALKTLKYLIEERRDFSLQDSADGYSLLALAVIGRQIAVARYLLQKGVKAHYDREGRSELFHCVLIEDISLVQLLLEHEFDPRQADNSGNTPLAAAEMAKNQEILYLMRKKLQEKDSQDPNSRPLSVADGRSMPYTALQLNLGFAIAKGELALCRSLLDNGADASKAVTISTIRDPLLYALSIKQHAIGQLLLMQQARSDLTVGPGNPFQGYSALHFCALFNFVDLAKQLLQQAPSILLHKTEIHPIHIAIASENNDVLRLMLEFEENALKALPKTRLPSLDPTQPERMAEYIQYADNAKLREIPSSIAKSHSWVVGAGNIRSPGRSDCVYPLQWAARYGNHEAVQILLEFGAPVDMRVGDAGRTPLHFATRHNSVKSLNCVKLLLDHNASLFHSNQYGVPAAMQLIQNFPQVCRERFNLHDLENNELHEYFLSGDVRLDLWSFQSSNDIGLLIGARDDVMEMGDFGYAFLNEIIHENCHTVSAFFLNTKFEFSTVDDDFGGALHLDWSDKRERLLKRIMRRLGHRNSVQMLNFKPKHRTTPLYRAAMSGARHVVHLFIKGYSPDLDLEMEGGRHGTALMVAAFFGRFHIVKTLVRAGASFFSTISRTGETVNVVMKAKHFPEIVRWLLVERITERRTICW